MINKKISQRIMEIEKENKKYNQHYAILDANYWELKGELKGIKETLLEIKDKRGDE